MRRVLEFFVLSVVLIASSCNRDEVITTPLPPNIILGHDDGCYAVKIGRTIEISLEVEHNTEAEYIWQVDGLQRVVTATPDFEFTAEHIGTTYITFTAKTPYGSDSEELRVDVVELEIPTIKILDCDAVLPLGSSLKLNAVVGHSSLPTTVEWMVDGATVAEGQYYTFEAESLGVFTITARATNEDGAAEHSTQIEVISPEEMPLEWEFESLELHTVVGRRLRIRPTAYSTMEGVSYCWTSDNGTGSEAEFCYTPTYEGGHIVRGTISTIREGKSVSIAREFTIYAHEEQAHRRPVVGTSSADFERVVEYTPAPGQFIGERKTAGFDGSELTAEAATAYAQRRLREGKFLSLGAFGGYLVVGFDHSITNGEGYDLAITGNSFDSSCEPGIVWVMQDENGNGEADDTWYELAGSETGASSTLEEYEVTYFRPTTERSAVLWIDNRGGSGEVDYLKAFHNQPSYYPAWITAESYTLRGTRLEARNYDASGNGSMWIQPPYDWGYADNYSEVDIITEEGEARANGFDIDNAIDFTGEAVRLSHIDFVKVQCAVQSKSGWVGELSTEVLGIYDLMNN